MKGTKRAKNVEKMLRTKLLAKGELRIWGVAPQQITKSQISVEQGNQPSYPPLVADQIREVVLDRLLDLIDANISIWYTKITIYISGSIVEYTHQICFSISWFSLNSIRQLTTEGNTMEAFKVSPSILRHVNHPVCSNITIRLSNIFTKQP